VVHNGIIENFAELKEELMVRGVTFTSDTDTEVIAHLLAEGVGRAGRCAKRSPVLWRISRARSRSRL
jgi:glucosamine 6-phosphate synthetase-like amidotransferase/phosphosugar isomerase protein